MIKISAKWISCIFVTYLATACGILEKDKNSSANVEGASAEDAVACEQEAVDGDFRVMSASLLARKWEEAFWPGVGISVTDGTTDLFAYYANQFGTNSNLNPGELFADTSSSTPYVLALAIVGHNASLQCESNPEEPNCQCADEDSAAAMLLRAIPNMAACPNPELVAEVAQLCREDRAKTISAIFSSMAVAVRN